MVSSLIFLDVHGVLTNASSKFAYGDNDRLDPVSVRLVAKLAERFASGIVVTSSIYLNRTDDELQAVLHEMGGKRLLRFLYGTIYPEHTPIQRGQYVADYLRALVDTPYVILDDKPHLYLPGQEVVGVDAEHGFKMSDYNKAAAILGRHDTDI